MSNQMKADLLGMPFGTATNKLRKMLLFEYVKRANDDVCYRCGSKIETLEEFSIEHTQSWQYAKNPKDTFFNLEIISFSHLVCNVSASRNTTYKHNKYGYQKGCRCGPCRESHRIDMKKWRSKE